MTKAVLGIIGGSGSYDLPGLTNAQANTISNPWGKPSAGSPANEAIVTSRVWPIVLWQIAPRRT